MWLNRFNWFLVFSTFCLIIAGGLVTSTDSGLAVPDWPKSYGMWMPPMVGGVFYEHGHRMVASFVGFLTVIFAIWLAIKENRKWVKVLGFVALGAVITQGILGGITVLYFLPMPVSVAHATLAQSFFSLVVCLAYFTSREWKEPQAQISVPASHRRIFLVMAALVYIQLILGAIVRHSGSALAIPDFPLAQGRIVPEFISREVLIHYIHRLGAVAILMWSIVTVRFVFKNYRESKFFVRPAILLITLVFLQIAVGGWTVLSKTAIPVATAHVAIGALILATSIVLYIRSYRHLQVARSVADLNRVPAVTGLKTS
jgi:cytochrome c oxidase assembly protein subunit 15